MCTLMHYTSLCSLVYAVSCLIVVYISIHREKEDTWCEEDELEAHSNWVRDVVWAPSTDFGLGVIASCSQVCCIYFLVPMLFLCYCACTFIN